MSDFYVKPGDRVSFAKTVGESDVYLFAGITGDLAVNHVNEAYMAKSKYGRRIAHGVLLVGFMSTCSTMMIASRGSRNATAMPATRRRCRSATTASASSARSTSATP